MKRLICLLSLMGATGVVGQGLPNRPSLSFDERTIWLVLAPRYSNQIKLGPGQLDQIKGAFATHDVAQNAIFAKGAATEEQLDRLDHQLAHSVLTALTPAQRTRLHQIGLQLEGPFVLGNSSIASEIGLTPIQLAKVHSIIAKSKQKQDALDNQAGEMLVKKSNLSPKDKIKLLASFKPKRLQLEREKIDDAQKILNQLTPAELAKWKNLLGDRLP